MLERISKENRYYVTGKRPGEVYRAFDTNSFKEFVGDVSDESEEEAATIVSEDT